MTEEWNTIEGYSRYKVSPDGEVFDTKTNKIVAKQLTGKPQYFYVNVNRDDGERKLERVHRFVAMAYVEGRSEEFDVVDHIDRNKFNNHYTNLRWVDHSGNQNNRDGNIFIFSTPVREYVQKYDNPNATYSYFTVRLRSGLSDQEVVDEYQEHLDYGLKRTKVLYQGTECYLTDLSERIGISYEKLRNKVVDGTLSWNSVHSVPETQPLSFEILEGGVMNWYPNKIYFSKLHCKSLDYINTGLESGMSTEEIILLDGKEYLRQTVRGITGTIKELCEHFGVSESAVSTNMTRNKVSLEDALFAPRQRVKSLSINGVYKSPKDWSEYFGLSPKKVNNWKIKNKKTFKEALEFHGVDTTEMTFSEI